MRQSLLLILLLFISCSKSISDECEEVPLKNLADFPIGTSFDYHDYTGSSQLIEKWEKHFNSFTPSNALKYANISPAPTIYDFREADSLVRIAQKNSARIHGHTLLWYQQNPQWLETYSQDYSELLRQHIITVVSRYKNSIKSWDVVNEGLTEDGLLRNSIWQRKVGNDYIYQAFKTAQDANPDAYLFYNDFNLAINPTKLDAALRLCETLRSRGIKNIGIGMQMHVATSFPTRRELAKSVEKIWKAGFKIHFSELDVSVNIFGTKTALDEQYWLDQQEKFYEIVSVYQQIPRKFRFGITLWGIGDADSWLPEYFNRIDAGLLFDHSYSLKPAYCGFKNALE